MLKPTLVWMFHIFNIPLYPKLKNTDMENYITLYNSIEGTYHTFPFDTQLIEKAEKLPMYQMCNRQELVGMIYSSLMNKLVEGYFTASLCYLLKSETWKIGSELGNNNFAIYISRGNGTGFARIGGSSYVNSIQEAYETGPKQIELAMSLYGEKEMGGYKKPGSNYTKPKKRKK